ncbi:MAG: hypothetical protein RSD13_02665 [Clostridium sp.]|uniref:hypothetical protein n=1 Tax=Clostridium sp. TaxID=1506 RepID=UPI002FC9659B
MSDYRMDIRGVIGLSEYSNIYDYLCVVDKEDKFTISIDREDEDSIHTINSMLKDNKFIVDENGYDKNGKYYINAHRYG